jgi:surface-anchored protein
VGYEAATQSLRLSIRGAFGAAEEGLHAPEAVCIRVPRSTYDAIQASGGRPEGSVWDPLGVAADESFWLLPASPVRNVPWFGLSTEGVPSTASFLGDEITLRFAIRTAPAGAHLAQYSVSTLGAPSFSLSTVAGLLTYSRPIAVHEHANWTFSAPGWWVLEAEASAGTSDGQRLTSPLALLRFHVEHR